MGDGDGGRKRTWSSTSAGASPRWRLTSLDAGVEAAPLLLAEVFWGVGGAATEVMGPIIPPAPAVCEAPPRRGAAPPRGGDEASLPAAGTKEEEEEVMRLGGEVL